MLSDVISRLFQTSRSVHVAATGMNRTELVVNIFRTANCQFSTVQFSRGDANGHFRLCLFVLPVAVVILVLDWLVKCRLTCLVGQTCAPDKKTAA